MYVLRLHETTTLSAVSLIHCDFVMAVYNTGTNLTPVPLSAMCTFYLICWSWYWYCYNWSWLQHCLQKAYRISFTR